MRWGEIVEGSAGDEVSQAKEKEMNDYRTVQQNLSNQNNKLHQTKGKRDPELTSAYNKNAEEMFAKLRHYLETECSDIIQYYKSGGRPIFHGSREHHNMFGITVTAIKPGRVDNAKYDEEENNIPPIYEKMFDKLLAEKGFKALRHNSIYGTGNKDMAASYGTSLEILFPPNGFTWVRSPKVFDLYFNLQNPSFQQELFNYVMPGSNMSFLEHVADKIAENTAKLYPPTEGQMEHFYIKALELLPKDHGALKKYHDMKAKEQSIRQTYDSKIAALEHEIDQVKQQIVDSYKEENEIDSSENITIDDVFDGGFSLDNEYDYENTDDFNVRIYEEEIKQIFSLSDKEMELRGKRQTELMALRPTVLDIVNEVPAVKEKAKQLHYDNRVENTKKAMATRGWFKNPIVYNDPKIMSVVEKFLPKLVETYRQYEGCTGKAGKYLNWCLAYNDKHKGKYLKGGNEIMISDSHTYGIQISRMENPITKEWLKTIFPNADFIK